MMMMVCHGWMCTVLDPSLKLASMKTQSTTTNVQRGHHRKSGGGGTPRPCYMCMASGVADDSFFQYDSYWMDPPPVVTRACRYPRLHCSDGPCHMSCHLQHA
jgi:hypothetical protein